MTRTITHKNLKRQFDIFERTEEFDDLLAELQFSTLLLPVSLENDTLAFPMLNMDDMRFAPVFTDVHEYNKCDIKEHFTLMPNSFNFYLNLLDERIDGIIIDVEGERFPLTREFRELMETNYVFDYDPQVFTAKEILQIRDLIDNAELEEFLSDESNFWDLETLLEMLLKSDLFKVVLSKDDLSEKEENGVIPLHGLDPLPTATTLRATQNYALLYSSEDEILPKDSPMHPYVQIVNLPELINQVLLDDLDGIVLNENTQNITIPRELLLNFMKDFACPNIAKYDDYAFPFRINHYQR